MSNNDKNIVSIGVSQEPSKFDKFFGQHFKSLVVSVLILALIISFSIIYCTKDNLNSEVITLFTSAIMGLIGFFAGSKSSSS
jgi:uncharacterized membrane protein YagU involved in acid resistance